MSESTSKVLVKDQVQASAKSVWSLVRDFGGIEKWSGSAIQSCSTEGEGIGALRTLTIPGGGVIRERLEAFDDSQRSFSYAIVGPSPLPVENYLSTLRVLEEGPESSTIEWSSTFEPAGAPEEQCQRIIEGIYRGGIAGIKKTLG